MRFRCFILFCFQKEKLALIVTGQVTKTYATLNIRVIGHLTVNARFSAAVLIKFYNLLVRRLIERRLLNIS